METFRTSQRRDFGWPWALPVVLTAWSPPELTFERPRECPTAGYTAEPDCPCPEHSWEPDLGRYVCLATKEARLHQRSQAVRQEIQRCLTRTRVQLLRESEGGEFHRHLTVRGVRGFDPGQSPLERGVEAAQGLSRLKAAQKSLITQGRSRLKAAPGSRSLQAHGRSRLGHDQLTLTLSVASCSGEWSRGQ